MVDGRINLLFLEGNLTTFAAPECVRHGNSFGRSRPKFTRLLIRLDKSFNLLSAESHPPTEFVARQTPKGPFAFTYTVWVNLEHFCNTGDAEEGCRLLSD